MKSIRLVMLAAVLLAAGCRTASVEQVASWREAVAASKEQSGKTFEAVKLLVRESQLDFIAKSDPDKKKQLEEQDVASGLPAEGVQRWNASLDCMAAYASSIEALLSPELPKGVGESIARTGEQIGATAHTPLLTAEQPLSKAIGSLGAKIVAAAANHEARSIMLETDPSVREVTQVMANMLYWPRTADENGKEFGKDDKGNPIVRESGVLPTVRVTYEDKLGAVNLKFMRERDGAARRRLAEEYAELLDRKGELEESIMNLRSSILDLGAAHSAAAQGRETDLRVLIAGMREDIKTVQGVIEAIKAGQ